MFTINAYVSFGNGDFTMNWLAREKINNADCTFALQNIDRSYVIMYLASGASAKGRNAIWGRLTVRDRNRECKRTPLDPLNTRMWYRSSFPPSIVSLRHSAFSFPSALRNEQVVIALSMIATIRVYATTRFLPTIPWNCSYPIAIVDERIWSQVSLTAS